MTYSYELAVEFVHTIEGKSQVKRFSFEKNWEEVKTLVDERIAVDALNAAMRYECTRAPYFPDWDSARGPWYYSVSEVVFRDKQDPFTYVGPIHELRAWAEQYGCPFDDGQRMSWRASNFVAYAQQRQELLSSVLPQPGTVDWYRCYGACMGLAIWCGVIGRMLMPEREWLVMYTARHACAVASPRPWPEACHHLHEAVFADLLWGDLFSGEYILENLLDGNRCRTCRLDEYANVLRQETQRICESRASKHAAVKAKHEIADRRSGLRNQSDLFGNRRLDPTQLTPI